MMQVRFAALVACTMIHNNYFFACQGKVAGSWLRCRCLTMFELDVGFKSSPFEFSVVC